MRFCSWASEPMEELSPLPILANIVIYNVCTEKGAAVLAPSTPFNLLPRIWGVFFKHI